MGVGRISGATPKSLRQHRALLPLFHLPLEGLGIFSTCPRPFPAFSVRGENEDEDEAEARGSVVDNLIVVQIGARSKLTFQLLMYERVMEKKYIF